MGVNSPDLKKVAQQIDDLRRQQATLLMATTNAENIAEISYAPYVERDGCFHIFVSELAAHTGNLLRTGRAGILFIENEADAENPFARRRLTYACEASEISPNTVDYEPVLQAMEDRFGNLIATLRSLKDFHLIKLKPYSGQFVAGFGKAYVVDENGGLTGPVGKR